MKRWLLHFLVIAGRPKRPGNGRYAKPSIAKPTTTAPNVVSSNGSMSRSQDKISITGADDAVGPAHKKPSKLVAFIQHPVVALINGGVVFLASLAAIAALIVILTPQPEPEPPVLASATALRAGSIHVGQPAVNVEEVFGAPIKSEVVAGDQILGAEDLCAPRRHRDRGRRCQRSLMSCLPNANLKITTSSATTVTLQGPSIASAESAPDVDIDPTERQLYYLEGGMGSSLGQLIETSVDQIRSGNGWRR
jgi:hypothetical protein